MVISRLTMGVGVMRIFLILSVTVFILSCTSPNKDNIDDMRVCSVNSDCISVSNGCCGCTAGGSNMAINSNSKPEWTEKHREKCKSTICPSVMSKHESCSAKPVCVNKLCELKSQ